MTPKCFQTLENGQRCSAPAIHGSKYCRHHDAQRPARQVEEDEKETLILPPLLNKPYMLVAVNQVAQALAEGRIKRSLADTLLGAIKFASRLLTEMTEAGIALYPDEDEEDSTLEIARTKSRESHVTNSAVDLAASAHRSKPEDILSAPPASPASQPPVDSSMNRFIKDLMAQTHQFARTQSPNGKS